MATEPKEITLCGAIHKIPELALRQRKVITPLWLKLFPILNQKVRGDSTILDLTEEEWDMLIEIVFQAMTRAYPHLTKDNFLDMSPTLVELVNACPAICEQAGFVGKKGEISGEEMNPSPATGENTSTT